MFKVTACCSASLGAEKQGGTVLRKIDQGSIVLAVTVLLFAVFAIFLNGFLTAGNLFNLLRNVSVLGILGAGMAVVIIGRGIDLSMVANMAISAAWMAVLLGQGHGLLAAMALALGFSLLMSAIAGFLVAYVEIPPLFATLSMATFISGFGHYAMLGADLVYLPKDIGALDFIGKGLVAHVPVSILLMVLLLVLVHLALRYTKPGRFIYAIGDNYLTARITGIPARPLIVMQYLASGLVSFAAGLIMLSAVNSMDTRIASSTLIYDVILVAVLGGVSLSGGKGSVWNVVIGTLLIGILFNGLTILNISFTAQNIVKALILLVAIAVDGVLNPRDEQTAQQGDI